MTNNTDLRTDSLSTLADHLLDSADNLDLLLAPLRLLMTPLDFNELCAMIDICPIHMTDIDTCLDDDLDCRR